MQEQHNRPGWWEWLSAGRPGENHEQRLRRWLNEADGLLPDHHLAPLLESLGLPVRPGKDMKKDRPERRED